MESVCQERNHLGSQMESVGIELDHEISDMMTEQTRCSKDAPMNCDRIT